ncbi:MAG: hypothetical protein C0478_05775 [Planctomyces sp.]|nr:hypothetical protein [Planctomyces sp.]
MHLLEVRACVVLDATHDRGGVLNPYFSVVAYTALHSARPGGRYQKQIERTTLPAWLLVALLLDTGGTGDPSSHGLISPLDGKWGLGTYDVCMVFERGLVREGHLVLGVCSWMHAGNF